MWNDSDHVFVHLDHIIPRNGRRVIDVFKEQRDDRIIHCTFGVGHKIVERGLAPEILIRVKDQRAMVGDLNRAIRRLGHIFKLQCQAFNIKVIAHQINQRDFKRRVFCPDQAFIACGENGRVISVVLCNRVVIDRFHLDRHAAAADSTLPVIDDIAEERCAIKILVRREQDCAVFQQFCRAAKAVTDKTA